MTNLSTFLESSLNFLSKKVKTVNYLLQPRQKVVSKFELTKTQFERTVRDKIICKTHLE